ncbi:MULTISPECIES: DUF2294 domain-containing protein [Leptolyngbya]|jgi:uncharacterized protein YbcI|uniref:Na+-translocating membrane potential-generating system MpsC domain-containing protein n=2 Tax=Leptolyngbya boryana TaxID=1184 RepID=A0A1Z4JI75_LEPBY|nr:MULTISPECIES: DUF2294 domain-containing protein [Leptolyngbya]BAY56373.1 hypothetical protein NIES2135_32040 [Leptolyngbya boryana NIES-2135]MBD2366479.1 DUF2294 domain-containing protein [Leptolyngbya sp. FACHB-161]MBD2372658.1 DUF2294 domain-containing protein [Leptolyngbya sp. FACHB-238]MBD2397081.1 DUF2294 domain-containing protein [Leptolyngbya sp. FACHB-239]MBD2403605.1 DUF2294 domain-containing protein [Leptolyngbya sp. FACHB-402]
MNSSALPTRGQLERTLSQRVQAFYRTQLGHQPSRVQCYIADGKITIVLEDSITKPEQLLMENGQEQLAEKVRSDLDKALHPQLSTMIQEIVGIKVVDIFSDATFDTGRSGTIVVLEEAPQLRESQPKRSREENAGVSDE